MAPIAKGVGDIVSVPLSVVSLLHSPITRCVHVARYRVSVGVKGNTKIRLKSS